MNAQHQWYYANSSNERQGPFEVRIIREKLSKGELNPQTLVWREGMVTWQPLSSVQAELTDAGNPPPMPDEPPADAVTHAEPADELTASPYTAPASTLSVGDGAVVSGGEIVYAGFWKRVAANVIDGLLINAVSFTLMMILAPIFGLSALAMFGIPEPGTDPDPEMMMAGLTGLQVILQLVLMVLTAAYFAWFHSSRNMATLGKMAVGIKVVRTDGSPITLARGIGRYFAFMLSSFTMGIGFIMAAFTGRKQTLHDMVCDTLVVDKWAFTDRPDLQQKNLGPVTIVILVLFGVLMAFMLLVLFIGIVAVIAQLGS